MKLLRSGVELASMALKGGDFENALTVNGGEARQPVLTADGYVDMRTTCVYYFGDGYDDNYAFMSDEEAAVSILDFHSRAKEYKGSQNKVLFF